MDVPGHPYLKSLPTLWIILPYFTGEKISSALCHYLHRKDLVPSVTVSFLHIILYCRIFFYLVTKSMEPFSHASFDNNHTFCRQMRVHHLPVHVLYELVMCQWHRNGWGSRGYPSPHPNDFALSLALVECSTGLRGATTVSPPLHVLEFLPALCMSVSTH